LKSHYTLAADIISHTKSSYTLSYPTTQAVCQNTLHYVLITSIKLKLKHTALLSPFKSAYNSLAKLLLRWFRISSFYTFPDETNHFAYTVWVKKSPLRFS